MKRLTLIMALALTACAEPRPYYAIDGDTISVGTGPHIRLLYIDAPELPGHCRRGRQCIAGDPYAAKAFLQALLSRGDMRCKDQGRDVYHRRLATCSVNGQDLGRTMLNSGLVGLHHRSNIP